MISKDQSTLSLNKSMQSPSGFAGKVLPILNSIKYWIGGGKSQPMPLVFRVLSRNQRLKREVNLASFGWD